MADTVPTGEPDAVHPATSWRWDVTYTDYPPSDGWSLEYVVSGARRFKFTASADSESAGYEVRIDPDSQEEIRDLEPGLYALVGKVTKSGRAEVVYREPLIVLEDHFERDEAQLHDEKMLALCDAALEGRIPDDLQFVQIGGRSISAIPAETLLKIQGTYRARVRGLRNKHGTPARRGVFVYRG